MTHFTGRNFLRRTALGAVAIAGGACALPTLQARGTIGHLSAALPHLANILARTGHRQLTFDPHNEQFLAAADADVLIRRTYRDGHWARL